MVAVDACLSGPFLCGQTDTPRKMPWADPACLWREGALWVRLLAIEPLRVFRSSIGSLDGAFAIQVHAGLREQNEQSKLACDVDADGMIDEGESQLIVDLRVGQIGRFPAGESRGSDWALRGHPESGSPEVIEYDATGSPCILAAFRYAPFSASQLDQDISAALLGDCTGNWPG